MALIVWLRGKKTYALGFGLVVVAGLKAQGYISESVYEVLVGVLTGGGLMALRAGVASRRGYL